MTNNDAGKNVYLYTIRNGKFFCHEGVIVYIDGYKLVYFEDDKQRVYYPRREVFMTIYTKGGLSMWTDSRCDEFVRRKFIEYEEQRIEELKKQLITKQKLVEVLRTES